VTERVRGARLLRSAFVGAIFANAFLLFLVQPLFGRMALPYLGGSAAVWTTCMLFFQAALLGGYFYAHALATWAPPRVQLLVHVLLLAVAAVVLPVSIPAGWSPADPADPVPSLLALLVARVGAPFMLLAAGSPLLQHWYARSPASQGRDAYALYAASNIGSAVALLAYPFVVEPWLRLRTQAVAWVAGYAVLVVMLVACGRSARGSSLVVHDVASAAPPTWALRTRWVLLAAIPSSLLLGVTTHLTTDLAPVPLLWVVPLTLYLATFVIAFGDFGRVSTRPVLAPRCRTSSSAWPCCCSCAPRCRGRAGISSTSPPSSSARWDATCRSRAVDRRRRASRSSTSGWHWAARSVAR
jgi:hypothetical protein